MSMIPNPQQTEDPPPAPEPAQQGPPMTPEARATLEAAQIAGGPPSMRQDPRRLLEQVFGWGRATGQPRPPALASEHQIEFHFDEVFDEWLKHSDEQPISVEEAGKILEGRLDIKADRSLLERAGDAMSFNILREGGAHMEFDMPLDAATKLAELIPEKYRTEKIVREMWTMPLMAMIARGDTNEGVTVNGVEFSPELVAATRGAFEAWQEATTEQLAGQAVASTDPETAEALASGAATPAELAEAMLTSMLNRVDEQFVTISPNYTDADSEILGELRDNRDSLLDEPAQRAANPIDGEATSWTAMSDTIGAGAVQPPTLTTAAVQDLFRTGMLDWETLIKSERNTDPAAGSFAPTVRMEQPTKFRTVGTDGQPITRVEQSRTYTPLQATRLLWSMGQAEIVNLQDKLARGGFMDPKARITRGDPGDHATQAAWNLALQESMRRGTSVDSLLRGRVATAMTLEEAESVGTEWAQQNLGRNFTRGEAMALKHYVTDVERPQPAGDLAIGSQIDQFFEQNFEQEAQHVASVNTGLLVRGWAKDWARMQGDS